VSGTNQFVLVCDWLGRPTTANKAHNMHHHAVSHDRRQWREAGLQLARVNKVPAMAGASFDVQAIYRRGPMPDTDAVAPAFKGFLDGLVDAGVLPGDTGAFVRSVRYLAPRKLASDREIAGVAALVVTITGETA